MRVLHHRSDFRLQTVGSVSSGVGGSSRSRFCTFEGRAAGLHFAALQSCSDESGQQGLQILSFQITLLKAASPRGTGARSVFRLRSNRPRRARVSNFLHFLPLRRQAGRVAARVFAKRKKERGRGKFLPGSGEDRTTKARRRKPHPSCSLLLVLGTDAGHGKSRVGRVIRGGRPRWGTP